MKIFLFFMISLSSLAGSLEESECPQQDIREKYPHLKTFFSTPRDQGEVGWCYAFTNADLLTVETGVPVSAFHVGALHNKYSSENFFYDLLNKMIQLGNEDLKYVYEGGNLKKSMNAVIENKKVCSESSMPYNLMSKEVLKTIEYIIDFKKKLEEKEPRACLIESTLKNMNIENDTFRKVALSDILRNFSINQNIDDQILLKIQEGGINRFIGEAANSSCAHQPLLVPKKKYLSIKNSKDIIEGLNSGKPVAIDYDTKKISKNTDGRHASSIIASRWNKEKMTCQFYVRNSWGKDCRPYTSNVECHEEEGSYWIDEKLLNKNLYGGFYFK